MNASGAARLRELVFVLTEERVAEGAHTRGLHPGLHDDAPDGALPADVREVLRAHEASTVAHGGGSQPEFLESIGRAPRPDRDAIETPADEYFNADEYYNALAGDERLDALRDDLGKLDSIDRAYILPGAEPALPAPGSGASPSGGRPTHLDDAPNGVGAKSIWNKLGGKGRGVDIVIVEAGWTYDHQDLAFAHSPAVDRPLFGDNSRDRLERDHGSAVAGVIGAKHDPRMPDVRGIAPEATLWTSSILKYKQNGVASKATAEAIRKAREFLARRSPASLAGHSNIVARPAIIVLALHRPGRVANFTAKPDDNQFGYIPVEWFEAEYGQIRLAADQGICVIASAGNGNQSLSHSIYDQPHASFDRQKWNNPFRRIPGFDSGAVLVGAGMSPRPQHSRPRGLKSRSNYGTCVDCQGWGDSVATCGYGDLRETSTPPNETAAYTDVFHGTSSATPIVAGVVACLQGMAMATPHIRRPLHPGEIRALLRTTGSPQTDASSDSVRVGPLPDLVELHEKLQTFETGDPLVG